ncbi:MAG: hypothetical protein H6R00_2453 [Proteobacteria bacterium]|nr:hypothetical protein [Pseudomonadota bacterium]
MAAALQKIQETGFQAFFRTALYGTGATCMGLQGQGGGPIFPFCPFRPEVLCLRRG